MSQYGMMTQGVKDVKDDKYLELRNKTVTKSNELIQKSRFSLSLQQQKILLYLISQITPFDEDFKLYQFSISEFCRVCGINETSGKNYYALKMAIKDIRDKSIWITLDDGRQTTLAWIEKPYIDPGSGVVQIRLDRDMVPFLLQLKKNFTKYEIIWTLHFKSKYTIRLYELIKSIHFHELEIYKRRYAIEELKRLLDGDRYKEYRDFKQRVLLPAIKEINQFSDKTVSFEEVRKGRKVLSLEFTISSKSSLDAAKIRSEIEREFGLDQMTLWEELEKKDLI